MNELHRKTAHRGGKHAPRGCKTIPPRTALPVRSDVLDLLGRNPVGLIRMALASPHYALATLAGMLILLLARLDILLGALDPNASRRSATDARTGTMQ